MLAYHFQALIVLFFGAAAVTTFFANPRLYMVIAVFIMVGPPIVMAMTRYYLVLDSTNQKVKKAVWFLGFKIPYKQYPYHQVERIFLNRVSTSQTLASYISQREFKNVVFKAFIKFKDGEKWFMDGDASWEKLRARTERYRGVLKTIFFDNFRGEAIQ